jgi:galactoside 2-L-fucosyltransferase 1/2
MDAQLQEAIKANCSAFRYVTIPNESSGRLAHVMSQVYILYVFLRLFNRAKLQHNILPSELVRHVAAVPSSRISILSQLFQPPTTLTFVTKEFVEQTCGLMEWEETSLTSWRQKFPKLFTSDIYFNTWPMNVMHLNNNSHIHKDLFRFYPGLANKGRLVVREVTRKLMTANRGSVPDEVVFVHIRRTDYVWEMELRHAMGMYTGKDVDDMITNFMDARPNAVYLIFSDDEKWCREHLASLNLTNVLMAPKMDGDVAFAAMASCDHGIATLGSFGLWAGVLAGGHLTRLIQKTTVNRGLVQNIDETLLNHEFVYFPK